MVGEILAVAAHKTSDDAFSIFAFLFVCGFATLLAGGFMPGIRRQKRLRMIFIGILIALLGSLVLYIDQLL